MIEPTTPQNQRQRWAAPKKKNFRGAHISPFSPKQKPIPPPHSGRLPVIPPHANTPLLPEFLDIRVSLV